MKKEKPPQKDEKKNKKKDRRLFTPHTHRAGRSSIEKELPLPPPPVDPALVKKLRKPLQNYIKPGRYELAPHFRTKDVYTIKIRTKKVYTIKITPIAR